VLENLILGIVLAYLAIGFWVLRVCHIDTPGIRRKPDAGSPTARRKPDILATDWHGFPRINTESLVDIRHRTDTVGEFIQVGDVGG